MELELDMAIAMVMGKMMVLVSVQELLTSLGWAEEVECESFRKASETF